MTSSVRTSSSGGQRGRLSIATIAGMDNQVTERPRVIKLHKGKDGYGFFLQTHRDGPMHSITEVEKDSAAKKAGLHNGDILACINGQDVMHASHDQCVTMVRNSGNSVELTVAPKHVMEVFYHHNISVEPDLPDNWQYLNDSTFSYSNAAFEDAIHDNETSFGGLEGGVSALIKNNKNNVATTSAQVSRFEHQYPVTLFSTVLQHASNLACLSQDALRGVSKYSPLKNAINEITVTDLKIFKTIASFATTAGSINIQEINASDSFSEDHDYSPAPPRICELTKENDEYGFLLLRTEDVGGHYITDIKSLGPADKAGIKNGDRLLEVNDESIGLKSHEEVIQLIASGNGKVTLTVLSEARKSNQDVTSRKSEQSLKPPRFCELVKKESGYGFALSCVPGLKGCDHFIDHVEKNGAADDAGIINGDRLLEVNDISTSEKSHKEVLELIAKNDQKVNVMVLGDQLPLMSMEIKPNAREELYRGSTSSLSIYEYRIVKSAEEEFEFFLSDDKIRNAQVINSITPEGPADRCGLRNGDTVIEVNGINVENKPHNQVVAMIKNSMSTNEVRILVHGESRSLPQLDKKLYQYHQKEKCVIS